MLQGKKIVLGVSGSIAAYKAAHLVRLLVKAGAQVRVLMTRSATEFITPLTLGTLSKNLVHVAFADTETGTWTNHVELGLWADVFLVAPASANTLARCAQGLANDLLVATYLSARCPVLFAPAMDLDMYAHPSTQANLERLRSYGNHIIEAEEGELASGLEGKGRMAEPETLVQELVAYLGRTGPLAGKRVLITAGPTQESLDPVRFISNHSSGKMGLALARQAVAWGATVDLVWGPASVDPQYPNTQVYRVTSAAEMNAQAQALWPQADIGIMAAAVADYRPKEIAPEKIKKHSAEFSLELEKTTDIAAALGSSKQPHQMLVGFALETQDEEQNALTKLVKKNLDWVVLNSLREAGAGFAHDTNSVYLFGKDNKKKASGLLPKDEVARFIWETLLATR